MAILVLKHWFWYYFLGLTVPISSIALTLLGHYAVGGTAVLVHVKQRFGEVREADPKKAS